MSIMLVTGEHPILLSLWLNMASINMYISVLSYLNREVASAEAVLQLCFVHNIHKLIFLKYS